MSRKPKSRPAVLDLDSLIVNAAPATQASPPDETPEMSPAAPAAKDAPSGEGRGQTPAARGNPSMFRTSVYFSRAVHDKLRAIAFEERKTITDLINEGLDHVLSARNYPSVAELRRRK